MALTSPFCFHTVYSIVLDSFPQHNTIFRILLAATSKGTSQAAYLRGSLSCYSVTLMGTPFSKIFLEQIILRQRLSRRRPIGRIRICVSSTAYAATNDAKYNEHHTNPKPHALVDGFLILRSTSRASFGILCDLRATGIAFLHLTHLVLRSFSSINLYRYKTTYIVYDIMPYMPIQFK